MMSCKITDLLQENNKCSFIVKISFSVANAADVLFAESSEMPKVTYVYRVARVHTS